MSRDPSKSRPLSDNVKRMMWLERASPRSSDVYTVQSVNLPKTTDCFVTSRAYFLWKRLQWD